MVQGSSHLEKYCNKDCWNCSLVLKCKFSYKYNFGAVKCVHIDLGIHFHQHYLLVWSSLVDSIVSITRLCHGASSWFTLCRLLATSFSAYDGVQLHCCDLLNAPKRLKIFTFSGHFDFGEDLEVAQARSGQ